MMVTIGLTGGLTILILGLAIFLGLWIDKSLGLEKNMFTFGLIILSLPLNIAALFSVARFTTTRYKTPSPSDATAQEETEQEDV